MATSEFCCGASRRGSIIVPQSGKLFNQQSRFLGGLKMFPASTFFESNSFFVNQVRATDLKMKDLRPNGLYQYKRVEGSGTVRLRRTY